jgi:plasmid stability protein
MTMTVKLDEPLERALRRRSANLGLSASVLMREALRAYLTKTEPPPASAFDLGQDLFGRHAGPSDLASARKQELTRAWDQKRPVLPEGPVAPARRGKA